MVQHCLARAAGVFAAVVLLPVRGAWAEHQALRRVSQLTAVEEAGLERRPGVMHKEVAFRRDGLLTVRTQDSREITADLEVPDSYETFMRGLMYRSSVCDHCSMMFAWTRDGSRPFWMKDTWIPLDLVWVSHDNVIVDIKQARANDLSSVKNESPAQYVFEFREHWCADHGVAVGDTLSWRHESHRPAFVAPDF
mmetsp:Transcript_16048/g.48371  ORF Transcript_16048/g.48371 Transcript_16048/m.48371 type:complete len:194 (+) Transcript_16048:72-653(+)